MICHWVTWRSRTDHTPRPVHVRHDGIAFAKHWHLDSSRHSTTREAADFSFSPPLATKLLRLSGFCLALFSRDLSSVYPPFLILPCPVRGGASSCCVVKVHETIAPLYIGISQPTFLPPTARISDATNSIIYKESICDAAADTHARGCRRVRRRAISTVAAEL